MAVKFSHHVRLDLILTLIRSVITVKPQTSMRRAVRQATQMVVVSALKTLSVSLLTSGKMQVQNESQDTEAVG